MRLAMEMRMEAEPPTFIHNATLDRKQDEWRVRGLSGVYKTEAEAIAAYRKARRENGGGE